MAAKLLTISLSEIDKRDLPLVGGKGANLGEMVKAGFPVPPGFAVTVDSYELFLKENSLDDFIQRSLQGLNTDNPKELDRVAQSIQNKIIRSKVPAEVSSSVIKSFKKLGAKLMAVRSSATAEDLPSASFAGQQATYLNISGEANLIDYIRRCWASLFTARAIFYRKENRIEHTKVKISVIVQKMVQSEVSGVMFTVEPVEGSKDKIVIEAVWGLGEMMVQGAVVPDRYIIQKGTFAILSREISDQDRQLIKVNGVTKETNVPKNIINEQKLRDKEIILLSKLGEKLQNHYYFPQDVEWAREKNKIFITQTRPITTLTKRVSENSIKEARLPILTGVGASPGVSSGIVKVLKSAKEIDKVVKGDVLVSVMTSPDFVPAMKKASAIITDKGGQTSHAAIVSRELGIPCVVGTKNATTTLRDGSVVSVDGAKGFIYLGAKMKLEKVTKAKERLFTQKTATKLYVNLAEAERVEEISSTNVDGVGLLRAEFMIAGIGLHPKEAIKRHEQEQYVDKLSTRLKQFCKPFGDNRPVLYRATDFKTNEYRELPGGKAWEPEEENPMLGYRGAFRYISDPEVFTLELRAIKEVRKKHKNLHLMIPFVRSPEELTKVRRIVSAEGLFEDPTFKFWMMVELPVNVILINDFIKVGIDGVSVGSNDLTMLTIGTDRDNAEVASSFDERSPSILWSLKRVIRACNKAGITSSICGQAPSNYEDLVEKLVSFGITSISVNPDAINRVRGVLINAERKFVTGKL